MPDISRFGSQKFVSENDMVFVDVETIEFPASIEMDVSYNSYLFASNGMLYLGTCCQGGSAHLIEYDPGKNEIRSLCNMDDLIKDHSMGYARQGKIHNPLCEAADGRIYGATHMDILFPFWSSFYDSHGYAGGHWFCYDPRTGDCTDLGLAIEREGILTTAMDAERQIIYGLTWPRGYLLAYDIRKGTTTNKGRASVNLNRFIHCASDGTVYIPGTNGHIASYHPDKDFVEDLPVRMRKFKNESDESSYGHELVFTSPVECDNGRSFVAAFLRGDMFKYDPIDGSVKYYDFFDNGIYINVQMIVGGDGKIYYALPAEAGVSAVNECAAIFRFDPETETNELVGYMRSKGHPQLFHLSGGVIGNDGTMYWFALAPRDPDAGFYTREHIAASGFSQTKPILVKYNPSLKVMR